MKRSEVIRKLQKEAKKQGVPFLITELTRHTGIIVGSTRSTLKRHTEIDDITVGKFFAQFANELGKGWWRK
ncbi:MAG: ribonuclease PH [Propionibacteriaceae bacterium]|jgi:hypothetical protein|nr:ribonuclease PH [Propionibacteriaceae bacterium]